MDSNRDGLAKKIFASALDIQDDALTRLAGTDPEAAELVKLRFFAGLTEGQTPEIHQYVAQLGAENRIGILRAQWQRAVPTGN